MPDLEWTVDRLRALVCTRKNAYGRDTAHLIAERRRTQGEKMNAYRCPFADGPAPSRDHQHWHVGHGPKMETLSMIARMIRGLPLVDDRELPPTVPSSDLLRSTV